MFERETIEQSRVIELQTKEIETLKLNLNDAVQVRSELTLVELYTNNIAQTCCYAVLTVLINEVAKGNFFICRM